MCQVLETTKGNPDRKVLSDKNRKQLSSCSGLHISTYIRQAAFDLLYIVEFIILLGNVQHSTSYYPEKNMKLNKLLLQ
jgi:hypothetical protein